MGRRLGIRIGGSSAWITFGDGGPFCGGGRAVIVSLVSVCFLLIIDGVWYIVVGWWFIAIECIDWLVMLI
jgi:hypothetical protein